MVNGKDIDKLIAVVGKAEQDQQLNGEGQELPELLRDERFIEKPYLVGQLTGQGQIEQREIAERMYRAFPELFALSTVSKPLVLQSTHVQRTKDSLRAFLERLVELQPSLGKHANITFGEAELCDPTLRFFDGCQEYKKYVKKHFWKSSLKQAVWDEKTKRHIQNILQRVFTSSFVKALDDKAQVQIVRNFYHLCQLDADVDRVNAKNRFCSLFISADEIEPFVWEEDAVNYFAKGFAGEDHAISYRVACPLLADFIATADQAIAQPSQAPIANLRFAHAETIIPFLVNLGLNREDTVDDMLHRPLQRKFRTSNVSPMAANVQWILYECEDNRYRVRMRHNEKDVAFPIPGCEDPSQCDWQVVKSFYENDGRTCSESTWETKICKGTSCRVMTSGNSFLGKS